MEANFDSRLKKVEGIVTNNSDKLDQVITLLKRLGSRVELNESHIVDLEQSYVLPNETLASKFSTLEHQVTSGFQRIRDELHECRTEPVAAPGPQIDTQLMFSKLDQLSNSLNIVIESQLTFSREFSRLASTLTEPCDNSIPTTVNTNQSKSLLDEISDCSVTPLRRSAPLEQAVQNSLENSTASDSILDPDQLPIELLVANDLATLVSAYNNYPTVVHKKYRHKRKKKNEPQSIHLHRPTRTPNPMDFHRKQTKPTVPIPSLLSIRVSNPLTTINHRQPTRNPYKTTITQSLLHYRPPLHVTRDLKFSHPAIRWQYEEDTHVRFNQMIEQQLSRLKNRSY